MSEKFERKKGGLPFDFKFTYFEYIATDGLQKVSTRIENLFQKLNDLFFTREN